MSDNQTIYFTFDIDWACDEVLEYTLELLEELQVEATIFVTHKSSIIDKFRKARFELGIHPNFNHSLIEGAGSSALNIIRELKLIVPEATSIRSHSLTRSTNLSILFKNEGFTHEANLIVPYQSGINLKAYEYPQGFIQVTHNWGDYTHCQNVNKILPEDYLTIQGLKVLNFHPIHLFLNTAKLNIYYEAKKCNHDYYLLKSYMNRELPGVRTYFEKLVDIAKKLGFGFGKINQINCGDSK